MIALPDQVTGKVLFFAAKSWLLLLPLVWRLCLEKKPLSWSPARCGGFGVACGLGMLISLIIVAAYVVLGRTLIDPQTVQTMAAHTGLAARHVYLGGALYWISINAVLEEYVWRWFVVEKFADIVNPWTAIVLSALAFTLHHIVAMQSFLSWLVTLIAAAGIFIGGAIWSWCYIRYRSIWPGYLSHALVDLAVFGVGYHLLFVK
jgi:membrane protease YdiL (CAAX protease family)